MNIYVCVFVFRFLFPDLPEEGGSLADPPKETGGSDPAGKQLESPKPGYVRYHDLIRYNIIRKIIS